MNSSTFEEFIEPTVMALLGEPNSKKGNEWRWGNHGSLAVDLEKGTWYDHESEEGGGTLDLIMRETGAATAKAAIRWLETQGMKQEEKPKQHVKSKIVKTYDYCDDDGVIQYQVCRMEPKGFRQRRPNSQGGWEWKVKGTTPLPYNLPAILAKPDATVIICEGEKDADNLNALGLIATTNSGGAKKWPKEIIPYFKGRRVVILPDNDEAGRKHLQAVAASLHGVAESVRVVNLPNLPEKGDITDWLETGTKGELIELCKASDTWKPDNVTPIKQDPTPKANNASSDPFIPIGYDGKHYFYFVKATGQICDITRGSHTSPSELISLAPIEYWESLFPKAKSGIDWQQAASDLMRKCERQGVYNYELQRGRGAWFDAGRSVLHMGNSLLVDGEHVSLGDFDTQYLYTKQSAMDSGLGEQPASAEKASELLQIIEGLNWSNHVSGKLMAGWLALAPICGGLSWRPHVWLTGRRGSGKSWVQDNIINPILGDSAVFVQGATTEAGLRQRLKHDARPVIFDEAEAENQADQKRIQGVVMLARQSSSDTGAEIVKGTANGDGLSYRVRSMFFMGSINVSLSQAADESRFSILSLNMPPKTKAESERFKAMETHKNQLVTREYCAAFRARLYRMIPVIRDNVKVLSIAAGQILGSQRIGDQIGTLLAGYHALISDHRINSDEADALLNGLDFSDAEDAESANDEQNLLDTILQSQVRFDAGGSNMTRTISELVFVASGCVRLEELPASIANDILGRFGLRVEDGFLCVSNSHIELSKILKNTPWLTGWKRILERIDGAENCKGMRFAGAYSRCIRIPIDHATG